jgi:putative nucleotidyltransferase with HDIG domain
MALIKEHPKIAEQILSNLTNLKNILPIIRHHHEAYAGNGYPDGLKGEAIPVCARILSIVDSFDAMTSERPHRGMLSEDDALVEIRKNAGTMFDPRLVEEFVRFVGLRKESPVERPADQHNETPSHVENHIQKAVRDIVEAFNRGHIEMPVFPGIIQKIRQTTSSANVAIDDLAKVIEQDPVVTLRLITASNSVHYGGAGQIKTVRQAIARMGINDTKDIASSIAMKSVYTSGDANVRSLMEKLWQHSIATAYMAHTIALKLRSSDAEMLFLLGLTHDIGKVLLLHSIITIFSKRDKNQPIDIEEILSGVQPVHATFGAALLRRWGFAENLIKAVAVHEKPDIDSQTPQIVLILFLANMFTRRIGCSLFTDLSPDAGVASMLLGLEASQIVEIMEEAKQRITETISSV